MNKITVAIFENGKLRKETINEDYREFDRIIGCRCFTITYRTLGNTLYTILVDDEGLLKENPVPSMADIYGYVELVGTLIFTGKSDYEGNLTSITDAQYEEIESCVNSDFNVIICEPESFEW